MPKNKRTKFMILNCKSDNEKQTCKQHKQTANLFIRNRFRN